MYVVTTHHSFHLEVCKRARTTISDCLQIYTHIQMVCRCTFCHARNNFDEVRLKCAHLRQNRMRFAYFSPNTLKLFVVTLLWTGSGGVFNSDAKCACNGFSFIRFVFTCTFSNLFGCSLYLILFGCHFQMQTESLQFFYIFCCLDVRRRNGIYLTILSAKIAFWVNKYQIHANQMAQMHFVYFDIKFNNRERERDKKEEEITWKESIRWKLGSFFCVP